MNATIRRLARKLRVPLGVLTDTYRELRAYEKQSREWDWTLRRRVWENYSYSRASNDFWRHGMHVRFPRAFGDGDRTMIPRWDETAAELAESFPELAIDGDPSERLFEIIARPYEPLATAEELWRQALDVCRTRQRKGQHA